MSQILLPIVVKYPVCVEGLSENAVRELANAFQAQAQADVLNGFVQAPEAARVKFTFDSTGNFTGVTALVNGKPITLISGVGSSELGIFKGPPTANNPGAGWQIEPELTQRFFPQAGVPESQWEIFLASRINVLNTIVPS